MKVLELFGGIGACSKALTRLGFDFEIVDYVEIDKYAVASFNAIHGTNFEPQDIKNWDKDIQADLIMHGSPCQDFSLSGKQAGGDMNSGTRSSLMYETIRIVKKVMPKYIIWENVKNLISKRHIHNFNNYLDELNRLGYNNYYKILNAKDYGIPQNRERVFTVSIRKDIDKGSFSFPEKVELKLKLKDLLEDKVDRKYYLSEKGKDYICGNALNKNLKDVYNREKAILNKNISYTISTKCDRRCGDSNYIYEGYDEITIKDYLKIRNGTKKGYVEGYEGDSVNLAYPSSKTRRGRVGKQVSQTLQCNDSMGVIVKEE